MYSKKGNEDVIEIDLLKLMRACLKKWWLIALVTVLAGVVAFAGTKLLVTPTYQSNIKLYVNNSNLSSSSSSVTTNDINASIALVSVYEAILDTKDTLDTIIEKAGLDYDYTELSSMLSTSSVNSTQVFQITVTNPSPTEAQLIAATIGEVLPDVIASIIDGADARIVEYAVVPTERYAPSYKKNALIGAFLGCFLIVVIIVLRELFDTTITSREELEEIVGVPILASIPENGEQAGKKYGYYYSYSR